MASWHALSPIPCHRCVLPSPLRIPSPVEPWIITETKARANRCAIAMRSTLRTLQILAANNNPHGSSFFRTRSFATRGRPQSFCQPPAHCPPSDRQFARSLTREAGWFPYPTEKLLGKKFKKPDHWVVFLCLRSHSEQASLYIFSSSGFDVRHTRAGMSPSQQAMLVSALCLLGLSHLAHGHGYLASPQSRNLIANSDYCPHCLNAGGGHKGLPVKFELSQVAIFVSDGFRVACSLFCASLSHRRRRG